MFINDLFMMAMEMNDYNDETPHTNETFYQNPFGIDLSFINIKNMLGSTQLTTFAQTVISNIEEGTVVFVYEHEGLEQWESSDEYIQNNYAKLYLAVKNENGTFSQYKYYRYFSNDSAQAQYYRISCGYGNEIFKMIKLKLFIEEFENYHVNENDIIRNKNSDSFTDQAKAIITQFRQDNNEGEIFFTSEICEYGDIDQDGPLEYYWTLYLFFKHNDGGVSHHKFEREFNWHHDKVDMDDVPYEESTVSCRDFYQKCFVL